MPVTLPPGRARLVTRPPPSGSAASAKTIGMVDVARLAAGTAVAPVTMTSTLRCTKSATISAERSTRPSAQRYSIATVRPSVQPSSSNRRTKAAVQSRQLDAVLTPRYPMVGSFGCCACPARGLAAAAPPKSVMNSRRRIIRSPRRRGRAASGAHLVLSFERQPEDELTIHRHDGVEVETDMVVDRGHVAPSALQWMAMLQAAT